MKYAVTFLVCCLATVGSAQNVDSIVITQHKLIQQSDSLMANYQFEKALRVLVHGDSLDIHILLRIGQCQFRLGVSQAAIRPYERVLEMDSVNVTALNQLGQLYARSGDFGKALYNYLQLIKLDSTNSYYYKQAGAITQKMDEENPLIPKSFYESALSLNPRDVEAAVTLGNIYLELDLYKSLDSLLQSAITFDRQYKPLFELKVSSDFKQKRYKTVVATLNELLTKGDTTSTYAHLLGVSYLHLQNYQNVIPCMNFMLKDHFDNDYIYYYLGVAYHELGNLPAAIENFNLAAKKSISENTGTYYSQLAKSYEDMGDYPQAIKAYQTAYAYSKEGILLYHLARNYDIYYKDKATARAYYYKYLNSEDTIKVAKEYSRYRVQAIDK